MPNGDDKKVGAIATIGKTLWPFWKGKHLTIKIIMLFALVAVAWIIWNQLKKELPTTPKTIAPTTTGVSSPAYAAGRDVVINNPAPPSDSDTKQDIRTLLESVNPEILKQIDFGKPEIKVEIGQIHFLKLVSLSDRTSFSKYMSYEHDGNDIYGSPGSSIGGYLND